MANATTDLGTLFVNLRVRDDMTRELSNVENKLKTTGKNIETVGKNFTKYLTVPLMGFGALAIKEFGSFEQAMSKVQATTGASAKDMAILTEKARDLGKTTQFSASEVSDAMNYMAMAGWDTTQVMDGLDGVLNLASASGEDLATVSDIVTDALTAFGMSAEDTNDFVDLLANTSRNANTNVSMLGESFKYVAPVAGSLGISAEQTALALGLMANAGIKGSQAGTALRASIAGLVSPTEKAQKLMDEYGIAVQKTEDGSVDLTATFANLKGAISGLDETQQANIITQIFGREAMSGVMAVINASEEDVNKLTEATTNFSGSAKEMSDTMNNNLKGNINKLKSAFSELLITVGENLLPLFTKLIEKLTDVIEWFSNLDEGTQSFMVQMGLLAVAIGPVTSLVGKLVSAGAPLVGLFTGAGSAVAGTSTALGTAGLMGAITPLLPVLAGVATAVGVVGAGFAIWNKVASETATLDFSSTISQIEGLSEASQQMIIETKEQYDGLRELSNDYFTGEVEKTKETYDAIQEQLDGHFINTIEKQEAQYAEQQALLVGQNEYLSEEDKRFMEEQMALSDTGHQAEKDQTLAYYEEASALLEGFNSGKIAMTEENIARYNELLDLMAQEEVESQIANGEELMALKSAQYDLEQSATAENASKVIAIAEEKRSKAVEQANLEFEEVKGKILMMEGVTEENKAKMIGIYEDKKNEAVRIANEEKSLTVQKVGEQYSDMYKVVDLKTGEIRGKSSQLWKQISSNQSDEIRKMNQDLGLGYQQAGDVIDTSTGQMITSYDNMGDRFDANTMTITDDLGTLEKRVVDYGKKSEESAKKASTAMDNHSKSVSTANDKTGTSADKAGEKVDKLKKKYQDMGREPNITKTITINERVNKAPQSAFTDTSQPRSVGRMATFGGTAEPLNIRALTGFNPTLEDNSRVGFSNVVKDTARVDNNKQLEEKLDKLIEVTESSKDIDVYLDKYTLVGSISEDISKSLARGVRR